MRGAYVEEDKAYIKGNTFFTSDPCFIRSSFDFHDGSASGGFNVFEPAAQGAVVNDSNLPAD